MDQLQNNTNEHHIVPSYEASFQDLDPTNQIIPSAPPPGIEEHDPELQPQPSDIPLEDEVKETPPSPKMASTAKSLPIQITPNDLPDSSEQGNGFGNENTTQQDSTILNTNNNNNLNSSSESNSDYDTNSLTNSQASASEMFLPEVTIEEKKNYSKITAGPSYTYQRLKYLKESSMARYKKENILKYETPLCTKLPPSEAGHYIGSLLERLSLVRSNYKLDIVRLAKFRQKAQENFLELFLDKHENVNIECQCKCKKTIRTKHEYWKV